MGLGDAKVEPAIPVSDMAMAKDFYEGKLGLSGGRPSGDGGITYPCGAGREIHIYPSPEDEREGDRRAGRRPVGLVQGPRRQLPRRRPDLTGHSP
jgi:catechol 2,3-dioxygenase-like lactoylglutathione lyase family enzyme